MLPLTSNPLTIAPMATLPVQCNPLLTEFIGARSASVIESELNRRPHLAADRRHTQADSQRIVQDARQAKTAAEAIGCLPGPTESSHVIISGRFALWDMVPATMTLGGCPIEVLHVATLGFSVRNVVKMAELVDAGGIGSVRLLCSHYFAGTSPKIYAVAVEEFAKRPDRMQFLSIRTHAKILLMALRDGRRVTIESSANLRSCKNIEQASIFGGAELYDFHRAWIDELFHAATASEKGSPADRPGQTEPGG